MQSMQSEKERSLLREWLKWMNKKELALITILLISSFFLVLFSSHANALSEISSDANLNAMVKIGTGSYPALSESGKIAYVSTKSGESELYVYDNGREIKLTNDIYAEFEPAFYDENNIIYISLASGGREIWKVNIETLEREQITGDGIAKYYPRANKKGEIAYIAGFYPHVDIYLWKNGVVKKLTNDRVEKHSLAWDENGDMLAFIAKDKKGFSIFLLNFKDKSITKIAENVYYRGLSLSNDKLVFVRRANNGYDIYEKELSTGDEKVILQGIGDSWEIDPSLTKSFLAFSTDKDGRYEIYSMPLDEKAFEKEKEISAPLIAEQSALAKAEPSSLADANSNPETEAKEKADKEINKNEIEIPEKEEKDEIIISKDEQKNENLIIAASEEKTVEEQEKWLIFILLSALSFLAISYLRKKEKTIAFA